MLGLIKKKFIILMLIGAAIWLVHTSIVFWEYASLWAALKLDGEIFFSQGLFYIIKNIPTFIALIIAQNHWDDYS